MKKVVHFQEFCEEPGDYVAILGYKEAPGEDTLWVDWKLVEIMGVERPNVLLYALAGSVDRKPTSDVREAEAEATGYCKWDGCAEITLNTHLCSVRDLAKLLDAIKRVYVECAKVMGRDALEGCVASGWSE